MGETIERAQEAIEEEIHHGGGHHSDPWARNVAILVSFLAAVLAMTEIGGKAAQNEYLTEHVALSNDWAFYQAKNLRAVVRTSEADILASLPNAQEPGIQGRIKEAHDYVARMRDDPKSGEGMKQLAETAHAKETTREEAFHRYHKFEYITGALEIAIVLASVSLVTRVRNLTFGAAAIGVAATLGSIGVALNVF